jgi:hypothetical protein
VIDTPATAIASELLGRPGTLRVACARSDIIRAVKEDVERVRVNEPELRPDRLDRTAHPPANVPFPASLAR